MKKKNIAIFLALAAVLIASAFAVFGEPGDSNDPIVTKSYVDAQIKSVKADSSGSYSVVHISEGQKIIGKEGTEIIVRSGEVVILSSGNNGISDITAGLDLKSGNKAEQNHLLLVPRDDGRGIQAVSEAYLMVRGGYSFK